MGSQQKTCNPLIVFILMVVAVGSGATSSICDNGLCRCTPPDREIATIDCRCKTSNTGFRFTAGEFGTQFRKVRVFYISDCDGGVTFTMNALKELKALESLYLENVGKVEFDSGVFHNLTRLCLRDIREIDFGERAFMGAHDLKSIEITRATVPRLRSHSLFDIRGLHDLELSNVTLHRVETDAVNMALRIPESHVLINNCTIDSIETKGIVLKAQNISILKSGFGEMSSNAININSSELVLIRESEFRSNLPKNAINIVATVLNIRDNTFKLLPTGIFMEKAEYEDNRKCIFTNNTVYNMELEGYLDSITDINRKADVRGNRFPCICVTGRAHQSLPDFSENNFCTTSKCNITLSSFNALIAEGKFCTTKNSADPDEYKICSDEEHSTTPAPRKTTLYFTTTQMPTTIKLTTQKPKNSSDRIQFMPAIVLFALITVIFKI